MHVLGIDAGGTKTIGYLADGEGKVPARGWGGANLEGRGRARRSRRSCTTVMDQGARGPRTWTWARSASAWRAPTDRTTRRRWSPTSCAGSARSRAAGRERRPGRARGRSSATPLGRRDHLRNGLDRLRPQRRSRRARRRLGPILGDEGSGYWIGRRALRAVARAADGRGPATSLTARVLNHFAVSKPQDLISEVYDRQLPHHALAQTARLVQQARDEGDECGNPDPGAGGPRAGARGALGGRAAAHAGGAGAVRARRRRLHRRAVAGRGAEAAAAGDGAARPGETARGRACDGRRAHRARRSPGRSRLPSCFGDRARPRRTRTARLEDEWDAGVLGRRRDARAAHFRPEGSAHRPRTRARLLHTGDGIAGIFRVEDRFVRSGTGASAIPSTRTAASRSSSSRGRPVGS